MTFSPLDGIRVVEMSHMIMGPSCGLFLGALGAEVIKIEPPAGDKTRALTGMGRAFHPTFNRGKKSVTLDLARPEGRDALDALLAGADVFVENFRDASLAPMGLEAQALRARFPRLIVASCKGFLHGPYQDRTAMDEVVQMMTGMAYMTGPTGRPLRIGSSANDIMAGLFAAYGVLGALLERKETGAGRAVRAGLFENCLMLVAQHMVQFDLEGVEPPPMPEREFSWPVYDIFETSGGPQIFVGAVTEGHWTALCALLDLPDLLADPSLSGTMARVAARARTVPIVAAAIAARSYPALAAGFEAAGLPFAPIARPAQMYDDPHVLRDGGLYASALPGGGVFRAPPIPIAVDGAAVIPDARDVAGAGADTDAVLGALGLSAAAIAAARGA
jgi:crotonobetainyl-CoA:carnitine CoA-transferase CaiB-like acyl-CoA transferase